MSTETAEQPLAAPPRQRRSRWRPVAMAVVIVLLAAAAGFFSYRSAYHPLVTGSLSGGLDARPVDQQYGPSE